MAISISDIKKLRDMTGAGMGDCKKALESSNGDIEGAIDFLRKLGQKLSVKRSDREAKEGVCLALTTEDGKAGIVLKLSCETDFVAKNEKFVALATQFAQVALTNLPDDTATLSALTFEAGVTVDEKVQEQIGVIGEKLEIVGYNKLESAEGQVVAYIHAGNRAAVIVSLNQEGEAAAEAGKNAAMQVAAMKPVAVNASGVDADTINREIEIGKEQARAEGKPEAMLEKIAQGKLQRFYKDNTLLAQDYVKGEGTVASYLNSVSKGLTVTSFKHIMLG